MSLHSLIAGNELRSDAMSLDKALPALPKITDSGYGSVDMETEAKAISKALKKQAKRSLKSKVIPQGKSKSSTTATLLTQRHQSSVVTMSKLPLLLCLLLCLWTLPHLHNFNSISLESHSTAKVDFSAFSPITNHH
jgi:hypothetical protein